MNRLRIHEIAPSSSTTTAIANRKRYMKFRNQKRQRMAESAERGATPLSYDAQPGDRSVLGNKLYLPVA
jgi:hypothetical protein